MKQNASLQVRDVSNATGVDGMAVLAPVEGRPLTTISDLSYASRASAQKQADFWNTVRPVDGFVVAVGPRNSDGRFLLIWKKEV